MAGVFERFPKLRFVLTEQGCAWVPAVLTRMDGLHDQMVNGRIGELVVAADGVLPERPSTYFARNCYVGASFPSLADADSMGTIGIDRIMWGSDYPHHEASSPFTKESLQLAFCDFTPAEMHSILGATAADVYGFDLEALAPVAARYGPTVGEIAAPLTEIPAAATSPAFAGGLRT